MRTHAAGVGQTNEIALLRIPGRRDVALVGLANRDDPCQNRSPRTPGSERTTAAEFGEARFQATACGKASDAGCAVQSASELAGAPRLVAATGLGPTAVLAAGSARMGVLGGRPVNQRRGTH